MPRAALLDMLAEVGKWMENEKKGGSGWFAIEVDCLTQASGVCVLNL